MVAKFSSIHVSYTYMVIVTFVIFERQTIDVFGGCSLFILLNILVSDAFACSCRDFFSYFPIFGMDIGSQVSSKPKNFYFWKGLPWEQAFPIG